MNLAAPFLIGSMVILSAASAFAVADLRPDKVFAADAKKNDFYIRDGLITGGDRAIDSVVVKDIRRAANPGGFERVVVDLEGLAKGEPAAISRAPFFQVSVTPDEKRVIFTIKGRSKLAFDSRKVQAEFKKSPVIGSVTLLPVLEDDSWSFVFELKAGAPVEVFELTNPVRIILDIKTGRAAAPAAPAPHKKSHG